MGCPRQSVSPPPRPDQRRSQSEIEAEEEEEERSFHSKMVKSETNDARNSEWCVWLRPVIGNGKGSMLRLLRTILTEKLITSDSLCYTMKCQTRVDRQGLKFLASTFFVDLLYIWSGCSLMGIVLRWVKILKMGCLKSRADSGVEEVVG